MYDLLLSVPHCPRDPGGGTNLDLVASGFLPAAFAVTEHEWSKAATGVAANVATAEGLAVTLIDADPGAPTSEQALAQAMVGARQRAATLSVQLHLNGPPDELRGQERSRAFRGTMAFVPTDDPLAIATAARVLTELRTAFQPLRQGRVYLRPHPDWPGRLGWVDDAGLRAATSPVLIECGYGTHPDDAALLSSRGTPERFGVVIGHALVAAIRNWHRFTLARSGPR